MPGQGARCNSGQLGVAATATTELGDRRAVGAVELVVNVAGVIVQVIVAIGAERIIRRAVTITPDLATGPARSRHALDDDRLFLDGDCDNDIRRSLDRDIDIGHVVVRVTSVMTEIFSFAEASGGNSVRISPDAAFSWMS